MRELLVARPHMRELLRDTATCLLGESLDRTCQNDDDIPALVGGIEHEPDVVARLAGLHTANDKTVAVRRRGERTFCQNLVKTFERCFDRSRRAHIVGNGREILRRIRRVQDGRRHWQNGLQLDRPIRYARIDLGHDIEIVRLRQIDCGKRQKRIPFFMRGLPNTLGSHKVNDRWQNVLIVGLRQVLARHACLLCAEHIPCQRHNLIRHYPPLSPHGLVSERPPVRKK